MSLHKVKNGVIIPLIAVIGYINLFILGTQSIVIVWVYAIELLIMIYLDKIVKFRPETNTRILLNICLWLIQIIVYFLLPSTNKRIYSILFQGIF